MRAALSEFRKVTDPLAVWLDRNTIEDPKALIPKHDLLVAYNAACEAERRSPMGDVAFGRAIKKLRSSVDMKQRTYNEVSKVWCYVGIALKSQTRSWLSHESHDSQDNNI